jgi:hypothetical protein
VLASGCSVDSSAIIGPDGSTVPDASSDGGACVPIGERCNGADDDCDGTIDEGFDLRVDTENCGACGAGCAADPPNAEAVCAGGECGLTCDPGFGACNEDAADGCEASLGVPASCGSCTTACSGATPLCERDAAGVYSCVAACSGGRTLCGMSCVDTGDDPRHCGGCDVACMTPPASSPTCDGGACGIVCDTGFADCNDSVADGCEVDTRTDVANCGVCGTACSLPNATAICTARTCEVDGCDTGFANCNGDASDGCEADLASDATCGDCSTSCGSGLSCVDGACVGPCPSGCTCSDTNCGRGAMSCSCNGGCTCDFECSRNCSVTCNDTCTVATTAMELDIDLVCNSGAMCTFDVHDANTATITCNAGSTCIIDCTDANNCDQTSCQGAGVNCQIDCTGANNCDFASCAEMEASCPGDIIVCNPSGACP